MVSPARVLILRSNPIAPDPRVEKTARLLLGTGYPVMMLGWDRTTSLPVQDQVAGAVCYRLSIRANYGSGLSNLPALLRWQVGLLSWLGAHQGEFEILHACDFDTVLPAMWFKKRHGKKVVYDIFDFYADHLRRTPAWIKGLIRHVDLRIISNADAVILVDDSRWAQIGDSTPKRSAVIYNTPEDVQGQIQAEVIRNHSASLRIIYAGLLMAERGLFDLISVMKLHPDWQLDLAGFGGDEERLVEEARRLENVHWHGRLPYAKVLELSCAADVLVATYDPSVPNHRYASPNKVFEAMMLGKPVIVARGTNMDRIITENSCGLVVPYGDIPSLESALERLQSDPDLRYNLGKNARTAYETTYSWASMKSRLLALYQAVESG